MDSPFLFNAPVEPPASHQYGFGYNDLPPRASLPSFGGRPSGSTLPNTLASLTLPFWPHTEVASKEDLHLGRSSEPLNGWYTGSIRPFTAPANAYQHSGYSQDEEVSPNGHLFASTSQSTYEDLDNHALDLAKPLRSGELPLSAGPTYRRPTPAALSQRSEDEPSDVLARPIMHDSSMGYIPPIYNHGARNLYNHSPTSFYPLQPRPATMSGALYGGLSRIAVAPNAMPSPPLVLRPERANLTVSPPPVPSLPLPSVLPPPASTVEDADEYNESPQRRKKRPRRRFDQIERIYTCSYPECTKGYGTLNHLNAHVTMQKHGPRRLPAEFKELRKEWKARKKAEDQRKRRALQEQQQREGAGDMAASEDEDEEDEEDQRRSPPPSNAVSDGVPMHEEEDVFAFQPPFPPEPGIFRFGGGAHSPISMAYPRPIRPQTAPSTETLSFLLQQTSPQLPTYQMGAPLSGPMGAYEQAKAANLWGRRSSLPNSLALPTLHEMVGESAAEHMGVYS